MSETINTDLSINIGMVGPSGSGKTSLLTAIYHETQERIRDSKSGIQFWPANEKTKKAMNRALAAFRTCVSSPDGLFDVPEMKPSQEETNFWFDFMVPCPELNNELQKVTIDIMDYPGGYVGSSEFRTKVFPHLEKSVALLVPVSTDMLMTYVENGNQNNPYLLKKRQLALETLDDSAVHVIIRQWIESRAGEYGALIFVPVKCEKWYNDNGGTIDAHQKVFNAISDLYKINELIKADESNHIDIACFPVDTYGIVEFEGTELETLPNGDEKLKSTFQRRDFGNEVKSLNACEVLLSVIISYLKNEAEHMGMSYEQLKKEIQGRTLLESLSKSFWELFGFADKDKEKLGEYAQKHVTSYVAFDELTKRFRILPQRQMNYKTAK